MRWMVVFFCVFLSGCGGTLFTVSQDEYKQRVQTLGVLPLMVDGSSIVYPQRTELAELLRRHNAGKAERLVEILRQKKEYFDVRLVQGDPGDLFSRLVAGSQIGESRGRLYRFYRFNAQAAAELARQEVADALLIPIMYGIERREKSWDRGAVPTAYLEADYSSIAVSAAVVTPEGEVLWEFHGLPHGAFLPLQYPGFEEAYYNLSPSVRVHDVTIEGIDRLLSETDSTLLTRGDFPRRYLDLFKSLSSSLDPRKASTASGSTQ